MSYELFEQGSGNYIPVLILSILFASLAYGAFPILYAISRKSLVSKKKYSRHCFILNFVLCILIKLLNDTTNMFPYLLWTSVGVYFGKRILDDRDMLYDDVHASVLRTKPTKFHSQILPCSTIVLILALGIATCGMTYFGIQTSRLSDTVQSQEAEIADMSQKIKALERNEEMLRDAIREKNDTITSQSKRLGEYTTAGYDFLIQFSGDPRDPTYNFKSDTELVVVQANDTSKKIKLTADLPSGVQIKISYSSDAARLSFDADAWSHSTTLSVHPLREGATVATFTNTVNSDSFKILILVID